MDRLRPEPEERKEPEKVEAPAENPHQAHYDSHVQQFYLFKGFATLSHLAHPDRHCPTEHLHAGLALVHGYLARDVADQHQDVETDPLFLNQFNLHQTNYPCVHLGPVVPTHEPVNMAADSSNKPRAI